MTREEILARLNTIKLSEELWEDNESILCFNGRPIGMTFHRAEVKRWWPELKDTLADYLAQDEIDGRDLTGKVAAVFTWVVDELNFRRQHLSQLIVWLESGLDAEPVPPQMLETKKLLADLRAGKIRCYRVKE